MHDFSYPNLSPLKRSSKVSDIPNATTNEKVSQLSPIEREAIVGICMLGVFRSEHTSKPEEPLDLSKTGSYAKKC